MYVSDAEETIAWMVEKDPMLSTDDYGRDLASVQALQRKHDTLERDLNALEEKVCSILPSVWSDFVARLNGICVHFIMAIALLVAEHSFCCIYSCRLASSIG